MRLVFALLLILATLAACQDSPSGPSSGRRPYSEHYGGMCSPYASNCW